MINIPQRILLGPGPSDTPARVLEALARPTIGHLDPAVIMQSRGRMNFLDLGSEFYKLEQGDQVARQVREAARPPHRAAQPSVGDRALGQREAVNYVYRH